MDIKIVQKKISKEDVKGMAEATFGEMVKGVVDLKKQILALGGSLHADSEAVLLENGSSQPDLWGFNIYPDRNSDERIEYTSLINIRPNQGNRSMEVKDPNLRRQIRIIIDKLVE